ncbi:MAG: hypothetical protein GY842_03435 [bacterium]|nr:hypothetical protein [bacterium]
MDNPSAEPTDHQTTDPTPAASTSIDDQAIEWPVRRFEPSGKVVSLNDVVVREKRIELMVNDTPLLAMLALPLDVEALVLGFLFSEGLWRSREHLPRIRYDADAGRAYCEGAFDEDAVESIHRRWTFGTGCGGGGDGAG